MLITNYFLNSDSSNHRQILREIIITASELIYICVPFLTNSGVDFLLDCLERSKVENLFILTSFSLDAIKSGSFSMEAIRRLVEIDSASMHVGVCFIMSRKGHSLHAKIYGNDDKALITSANLTGSAFTSNEEVGYLLTGVEAETVYEHWFRLWTGASEYLTIEELNRLEHLMETEGILPSDLQSLDYLENETKSFAKTLIPPLPVLFTPAFNHIDEEKSRKLAQELAGWLIEKREIGIVARWRQEAAEKWGIQSHPQHDYLSDFDYYHTQTRYSARIYSYAWIKNRNWNRPINLISVPTTVKGSKGFQSFPVKFLKPNSQHGSEILPVFTYPAKIDKLFQDQADENGIYWNQYPVIDLSDGDALERAKTVLEYVLKNC